MQIATLGWIDGRLPRLCTGACLVCSIRRHNGADKRSTIGADRDAEELHRKLNMTVAEFWAQHRITKLETVLS